MTENKVSKWGAAAAALSLTVTSLPSAVSAQRSTGLSQQAQLARDFAFASGRNDFLILDKINAKIIAFENGREIFESDVFLGASRSDDIQAGLGATPAGAFRAVVADIRVDRHSGAFERYGSYIPYMCVQKRKSPDICYSIHPTLQTAQERRAQAANNPAARHISHGCVRAIRYPEIADFLRRHQTDGATLLINLPYDQARTRSYLKIPNDFQSNTTPN